jgi:colanic acid biosynthesis protein WcaM
MTGVVPVVPRFKFTDESGNPLALGSVTVYQAGTTTLANTYQDRALTTLNTNPVTLDANGECLFWVSDAYEYKFLLKNAAGATVSGSPTDNIPSTGTSGFLQAGAGAVRRTAQAKMREIVSVTDFYDGDWATAFTRAYAAGKAVEVPPDTAVTGMNSVVTIPAGKDLVIYGSIAGNGSGRFDVSGTCEIFARGGTLADVPFKLLAGGPRLKGLRMSGYVPTAQILIQGVGTYRNVVIDDFLIENANYGILRQGAGSSLVGAQITRGQFYNLKADAIEFNVCVDDVGVQVIDHYIDTIDNTAGTAFWGIGIGFAGSTYDNTYPDNKTVKDFTIAKIRARKCRQLIHVEMGKRFDISEISATEISTSFSAASGLEAATVIVYGSTDFVIDAVQATDCSAVQARIGTSGASYIAAPQNFTVRNCRLSGTGIYLEPGNAASTVAIRDNEITGSGITVVERPGRLIIENNHIERTRVGGSKALTLQMDLNTDGRGAFRAAAYSSSLVMRNNTARDEYNTPSTSISGCVQAAVTASGNNFNLEPTGTVLKPLGRTFRVVVGDFPYGVEFVEGDLVIDTAGSRWMVTGDGSRNRATDTFEVISSTVVKSTGGYAWTDPNHHEPGQRITLSGAGVAGADLETVVVRTFIEAATYRIEVADAITAAVGATGTITATAVVTYVVV